ncbi:2,3-diaminopropionate biosynthesis protein SbnA [Paenibacillus sp. GCM10027627]|uniref:2,3-diaminopropionate biosynthesis protein SbnA n=1 Tax=unclassified Paenibacillus TaxID=185978 RepID=UPI00363FBAE3
MPVMSSVLECIGDTPLVRLDRLFPDPDFEVMGKLECMNPGGSMKDRPAKFIIEQGFKKGTIHAKSHIVESTSGNLGIALAMMGRLYGLTVTCVVDPKVSAVNLKMMRQMGANIEMVTEADEQGGYLLTRIAHVQRLLQTIPNSVWINQYANADNWRAHFEGTGAEIASALDDLDVLIAGVSTSGSIMGTSRKLKEKFPMLEVVGVDAVGSIIFGGEPGSRDLPGIGASRVPELLNRSEIDSVYHINDLESANGCRALMRHEGIFAGGSSGSVVAAAQKWMAKVKKPVGRPLKIVMILPDRGERYMDKVYDDDWYAKTEAIWRNAEGEGSYE